MKMEFPNFHGQNNSKIAYLQENDLKNQLEPYIHLIWTNIYNISTMEGYLEN